jgi:hypothetical protein
VRKAAVMSKSVTHRPPGHIPASCASHYRQLVILAPPVALPLQLMTIVAIAGPPSQLHLAHVIHDLQV